MTTDISIGTLFKFLGEQFDENEEALTIVECEQMDFIRDLSTELEKIDGVTTASISEWVDGYKKGDELPGLEIKIVSFYDERKIGEGSFVVRFVEGSEELSAFAKPWSHASEGYPVHSTSQVIQMVQRIRSVFEEAGSRMRVKEQKNRLSNQFVVQGLKARVAALSRKMKFDFAIHIDELWVEVLIEKDGVGPAAIVFSKDEKQREVELENLAEYVDHALAHLPYVDRVTSGSYRVQYNEDLLWYRFEE